jgi:hypothetical protein
MDKSRWFKMRITEQEFQDLEEKSSKAGVSKSNYMRGLLNGVEFHEKPDQEFLDAVLGMSQMGNNLNQLAWYANAYNIIDEKFLVDLAKDILELRSLIIENYITSPAKRKRHKKED